MVFIKIYALPKFLSALDISRFKKYVRKFLAEYIEKDPSKITIVFMNFVYDGSQGLDDAFFVETVIQGSWSGNEKHLALRCQKAIIKALLEPGMTNRYPEKIEMFPQHVTSWDTLPEEKEDPEEQWRH